MKSIVKSFYHRDTNTWTHVVYCSVTKKAVIIDPVLDYNLNNAKTSTQSIDEIISYINHQELDLEFILETHAHADHLSSAAYIRKNMSCIVAIGSPIQTVQATFKKVFNLSETFKTDGSQFQLLLEDGDTIDIGKLTIEVMHTPGHTNDSMSFIVEDNVFIGDTLFSPDYGTARCDFPGGDAGKLFDSIQNIFSLGGNKRLYLCHDYPQKKRQPQAWFLCDKQKVKNIHICEKTSKNEFITMRNARDATLNQPRLLIPSIQVNIRAGELPQAESNGICYLKIPINVLSSE